MEVRFTAHYVCMGCAHEWWEKRTQVECPECGHVYVAWLNFHALRAAGFQDPEAWLMSSS